MTSIRKRLSEAFKVSGLQTKKYSKSRTLFRKAGEHKTLQKSQSFYIRLRPGPLQSIRLTPRAAPQPTANKPNQQEARNNKFSIVDPILQCDNGNLIKWRTGRIIGQGSEAQVMQALNLETGKIFAVKRLYTHKKYEAEIIQKLDHPNIVSYLGSEMVHDSFCIYLEYMPGGSLKSLIDKIGPIPEALAKIYIKQILTGLEYLHSKEVVHCDLKASNILLGEDTVKLSDFGFSRDVRGDSGALKTVRGSLAWTAPEMATQRGYGRKADIWSLGCTVLQMLTGRQPWSETEDMFGLLMKLATSQDTPMVDASLSAEAKDFIGRCLVRDVEKRATCDELNMHKFLGYTFPV